MWLFLCLFASLEYSLPEIVFWAADIVTEDKNGPSTKI